MIPNELMKIIFVINLSDERPQEKKNIYEQFAVQAFKEGITST